MAAEYYNAEIARQQERLAATPDMAAQRAVLLRHLALRPGERVLDIGSGSGIFARALREAVGDGGRVCGVDNAEAMLAIARALCPGAEFRRGDATALPFGDAAFDAISAAQLLCFVADADAALGEMHRVLRPGGRAVILDTDWESLVWNSGDPALMARVRALYRTPYADAHVPRTLSRRLASAGFAITGRHCHTILNWTPDPASYAWQTIGFIEVMMRDSPDFTPADWEAFIADQHRTASAGDYLFSLNRYIFRAEKPA